MTLDPAINVLPNRWVDEYGDYLFNYTISRINNVELTCDLIQDTFLAALKSQKSFEGRSTKKIWLSSILKRKIFDYYRKQGRNNKHNVIDTYYHEGNENLPLLADVNSTNETLELTNQLAYMAVDMDSQCGEGKCDGGE